MKWTEEQEKVLKARNKEILVAAAAGSGKTAVLVERVIRMITDKNKPVDIDRLLILTFTRAAAAEMKARIIAALEERLEDENLDDKERFNLQRQALLANCANIGTIDSFFQSVVKDNFNEIGIEPSFRVASEKELNIIKNAAMKETLDNAYEEASESFLDFIEEYVDKKTDDNVEKAIYKLYNFSRSHTSPTDWLNECINNYRADNIENSKWFNHLREIIETSLEKIHDNYSTACFLLSNPETATLKKHEACVKKELAQIELIKSKPFSMEILDELKALLELIKASRISASKNDDDDKQALGLRKYSKEILEDLCEKYCAYSGELQLQNVVNSEESTKVLVNLTKEFARIFKEKKLEKNLVDFSDLGHYALEILVEGFKSNGITPIPTEIAMEISERFDEIIVDEYQDTNYIQEAVLDAVSKKYKGEPNIFRVGDVKQSIYKFRMAKPELFIEKFDNFVDTDLEAADDYLICLDKNFRSRKEVVDAVNGVFDAIMIKDFGGVDYEYTSRLEFGFTDYPEPPNGQDNSAEFVFIDSCDEKVDMVEASYIADRIDDMISSGFQIYDKKNKCYKKAGYGDITVLYRSAKKNIAAVQEAFGALDIPFICDTNDKLYEKKEVILFVELLRLIDNPNNDLALVTLLKSQLIGLSSDELALMRIINNEKPFYKLVYEDLQDSKEEIYDKIKKKTKLFMEKLKKYRLFALHNSVRELIHYVLGDSSLYDLSSASANGGLKAKNLEMLEYLAADFESYNESSLFSFLQYYDALVANKENIKAAVSANESEDAVKIMTIHSSKGLEFPICFVAGLSSKFNDEDMKQKVVSHDEMGIGVDYMDSVDRVKYNTLVKSIISAKCKEEMKEEEIRLLYVAMTRAEEKLIMVSTNKNMSSAGKEKGGGKFAKWKPFENEASLHKVDIASAGAYADWLGMVSALKFAVKDDREDSYECKMPFAVFKFVRFDDIIKNDVESTTDIKVRKDEFKQLFFENKKDSMLPELTEDASDADIADVIAKIEKGYDYENDLDLKTKMSVSEIKKMSYHFSVDEDTYVPEFVKKAQKSSAESEEDSSKCAVRGTERGSAYHRVFELLDLKSIKTKEDLEENIKEAGQKGLISEEWIKLVNVDKVMTFVNSDIGQRMSKAQEKAMLFRERPYVMGVSAKEIDQKYSEDEMVLVQGIIDAYFEEDGKIVIVDYKTDRVEKIEELSERYKVQLDYYEKAIAQVTGMEVSEKVIYSVAFGKGLNV